MKSLLMYMLGIGLGLLAYPFVKHLISIDFFQRVLG